MAFTFLWHRSTACRVRNEKLRISPSGVLRQAIMWKHIFWGNEILSKCTLVWVLFLWHLQQLLESWELATAFTFPWHRSTASRVKKEKLRISFSALWQAVLNESSTVHMVRLTYFAESSFARCAYQVLLWCNEMFKNSTLQIFWLRLRQKCFF